jgi:hypothetical protein
MMLLQGGTRKKVSRGETARSNPIPPDGPAPTFVAGAPGLAKPGGKPDRLTPTKNARAGRCVPEPQPKEGLSDDTKSGGPAPRLAGTCGTGPNQPGGDAWFQRAGC